MIKKESEKFTPSNIFEGMTSISALISAIERGNNDRIIIEVKYDYTKKSSKRREIDFLRRKSSSLGFVLTETDASEIEGLTIGNTHGGIIAICSDRNIPDLSAEKLKDNGFYVMLEGIEDPYNFGYSLRSLYAAGVDGIILTPRNWMSAAGVVARASAGASELIDMFVSESESSVEVFKSIGYKVVCAGIRDSVSLYNCDLKKPVFLIVGGEKRGISRAVLDKADSIVRIDYGREFMGSLSAASASTVLGFEVYRQNK